MIDKTFLICAILFMGIFIARDILKRKYNIDMDKIMISKSNSNLTSAKVNGKFLFKKSKNKKSAQASSAPIINRGTGDNSLIILDAGVNKATVMATLRQITGIDYNCAKQVVNSAPYEFMTSVSYREAVLTKNALEFVGAKIKIQK